jgi:transposase-like protein
MCLAGATDTEIADEIGVSVTTLYNWRAKYPEFLAAIRYGKEHADERVERLVLRAGMKIS